MDADEEHNDDMEAGLHTGGDDCACDRRDCLKCVQLGYDMLYRMYRDAEGRYRKEQALRIAAEKKLQGEQASHIATEERLITYMSEAVAKALAIIK